MNETITAIQKNCENILGILEDIEETENQYYGGEDE